MFGIEAVLQVYAGNGDGAGAAVTAGVREEVAGRPTAPVVDEARVAALPRWRLAAAVDVMSMPAPVPFGAGGADRA
jgi:hypothetical protein